MATNNEVIGDALGLLGVVNENETLTAEQGAHGLRVLNDLMAEWASDGIDVGHFPQVDPTQDFPASYKVLLAAKYNLAVALSPHYQKPIDPVTLGFAQRTYSRLTRDAAISNLTEAKTDHLPLGYAGGGWYDIQTDG